MICRHAEHLPDLPVGVPVHQHPDGLEPLGRHAGGPGLRPLQARQERRAGFPLLRGIIVQHRAGQLGRIGGDLPPPAGGALQFGIDFIADEPVGVGGKGHRVPRFIRLGRFAKPQAADLEQVVV